MTVNDLSAAECRALDEASEIAEVGAGRDSLIFENGWLAARAFYVLPRDDTERVATIDEMKFGPRSYTPEQQAVIDEAVSNRQPLTAPELPKPEQVSSPSPPEPDDAAINAFDAKVVVPELQEDLAAAEARETALREALSELVALRALKELNPSEYAQRSAEGAKDRAWETARAALRHNDERSRRNDGTAESRTAQSTS